MFAKLRGLIDERGSDWVVVDIGGVGYLVSCSARTLDQLPGPGEAAELLIETHVREDRFQLFGFATALEREWFRLLVTVQGVGNRVAVAILSAVPPDRLAVAIAAQDKAELTRADGVGPKLAQRIVTELKDKAGLVEMPALAAAGTGAGATAPGEGEVSGDGQHRVNEDAVSALVNLGYGRVEAFGAVAQAARGLGENPSVDLLIPAALRELGQ